MKTPSRNTEGGRQADTARKRRSEPYAFAEDLPSAYRGLAATLREYAEWQDQRFTPSEAQLRDVTTVSTHALLRECNVIEEMVTRLRVATLRVHRAANGPKAAARYQAQLRDQRLGKGLYAPGAAFGPPLARDTTAKAGARERRAS
jgi:hypothetical protein